MTDANILIGYLLKKNPDATIKDWTAALKDIEEDSKPVSRWDKKEKKFVMDFLVKTINADKK